MRGGIDLRGQRQTNGWLEAIKPGKSDGNRGIKWKCFCHLCKVNTRMVLARDFTSERIKKCRKCANPFYRDLQKRVCETRKQKQRELGPPMYSDEFRRSWKAKLEAFTPGQRLLFDVILDGRSNWHYEMQAVHLVLHTKDLRLELTRFKRSRVLRNMERASQMLREQRAERKLAA